MNHSDKDSEETRETLEHLLGVVTESRERRCADIREQANQQAKDIIRQAYAQGRNRLHQHVRVLREKYQARSDSANARKQTLLRQQQHNNDKAVIDHAWPVVRLAILILWDEPESRKQWLAVAVETALSILLGHEWLIEHAQGLDKKEIKMIYDDLVPGHDYKYRLVAVNDISAGIRISAEGTVVDVTLEGLLSQKHEIEADLLARIKKEAVK